MAEGVVELTDADFEEKVIKSDQVVVVDFWASWCGPCRMIGPIIEGLAKEYAGRITVGKINVDNNHQTAAKYGIMSIPAVLIFKGGNVVESMIGARSKAFYVDLIDKHLG
jgi:thioredoxin 1